MPHGAWLCRASGNSGAVDFQAGDGAAESKYILRIFILVDNYMPFSGGASP
jgi:hypothetical protein